MLDSKTSDFFLRYEVRKQEVEVVLEFTDNNFTLEEFTMSQLPCRKYHTAVASLFSEWKIIY